MYSGDMELLFGSNNAGKAIEIHEALAGLSVTLRLPRDVGFTEQPEETGTSYAENAIQKARFYRAGTGLPTIADDSGIIIDALQNELGIHTRRWGAGPDASDEVWIAHFLKRMKTESNRRARFVCVLAFAGSDGDVRTFKGVCDGIITAGIESDYLPGLPVSACFRPDGFDTVFSALTIDQKNSTSHRGRAASLFRNHLQKIIG